MTAQIKEWVDPARFAEWIGHGFSAELTGRMLANRRLSVRCTELIGSRLGVPSPSAAQSAALLLDGPGLTKLTQSAGVVWHAPNIVRLIEGAAVRNLIAVIGADLRLFAIRNVLLAPPIGSDVSADALPDEIALAGQRCLAAWCNAQPDNVGVRIKLRMAERTEADDSYRTFAPTLVDTLLGVDREQTA